MGTRVLTILNHITVKNGDRPGTRFELRCYLPGDAEGTVVATEFGQYLLIPSWQAEGVAELLKLQGHRFAMFGYFVDYQPNIAKRCPYNLG